MARSVYDFCFTCPNCGYRRARCFSDNTCLTRGCGYDLTETIKEERDGYYKMVPLVLFGCIMFVAVLCFLFWLARG